MSGAESLRVSCVIPTHNRPDLLRAALASVAAQTAPPSEIVVVDDGGEARVSQVLRETEAETGIAARHVLNPHSTGASSSRNLGARVTTGDVLAFLDDDDRWAPEYLQEAIACLRTRQCTFVVTWMSRFQGRRTWPGKAMGTGLRAQDVLAINPGLTGSNVVLHRSAFELVDGFDEALTVSNDKDLLVRLLDAGLEYAVVERRLVDKRMHPGSRLGDASIRRAEGLNAYIRKHEQRLSPDDRRRLEARLAAVLYHTASTQPRRWRQGLRFAYLEGVGEICRQWSSRRPVSLRPTFISSSRDDLARRRAGRR